MQAGRVRAILSSSLIALSGALAFVAPAHAQWPPEKFENLKVLPQDITWPQLFRTMSGFTRALGVRCSFCHVGDPNGAIRDYNFTSDEKPTKRKARKMLEMVEQINGVNLAGLESRSTPEVGVQCITCHRGANKPRMIEDVLLQRYERDGIDSTLVEYRRLREQYYGNFAYDFGPVPLVNLAAQVVTHDNGMPDALRLLELNVRMNPDAPFALTQLMTLTLNEAFNNRGADAGRQAYVGLVARFGVAGVPENLLNTVGYSLLRRNQTATAVAAFQLNVETHPESANAYDSLGEGLAASGDIQSAIKAYERSLALNPNNQNAVQKLRELRGR